MEDKEIDASCLSAKWRIKDEGEEDRNVSLVLGMMIE
jgi:hypothetical protein